MIVHLPVHILLVVDSLVDAAYQRGQATEAAAFLEIDAVIDPADTRAVIIRALASTTI